MTKINLWNSNIQAWNQKTSTESVAVTLASTEPIVKETVGHVFLIKVEGDCHLATNEEIISVPELPE